MNTKIIVLQKNDDTVESIVSFMQNKSCIHTSTIINIINSNFLFPSP